MFEFKKSETLSEILREVAGKFEKQFKKPIPTSLVNDVAQSQFFLLPATIENLGTLKLDYIGKFTPIESRVEVYKELFGDVKKKDLSLSKVTFIKKDNATNSSHTKFPSVPSSE